MYHFLIILLQVCYYLCSWGYLYLGMVEILCKWCAAGHLFPFSRFQWRHIASLNIAWALQRPTNATNQDYLWTSPFGQWMQMHLSMQGTRIWFLVWEDSTCYRATKPEYHSYRACTVEPTSHNSWDPRALEPVLCNKRNHCNEKPAHCS